MNGFIIKFCIHTLKNTNTEPMGHDIFHKNQQTLYAPHDYQNILL